MGRGRAVRGLLSQEGEKALLSETGVRESDRVYSIQESIGFFLSLNLRRIKPLMDQRLQEHGVSYGSWFFLRVLWEEEGLTQATLASRLSFSPATTLSALRKLVVTDTLPLPEGKQDRRIEVVSVAPLLADAIRRIHEGRSIAAMMSTR